MEQIAAALECSLAKAERDWRYARAWLRQRLGGDATGSTGESTE